VTHPVTITLPRQIGGTAVGWRLTDYVSLAAQSGPATDGVAMARLPQLAPDELWLIDHAVVACTSSTPTSVRWYAGEATAAQLLDGSAAGNFDVGDWTAGLQIVPGSSLLVVWSGASLASVGTITVQARVLRRT